VAVWKPETGLEKTTEGGWRALFQREKEGEWVKRGSQSPGRFDQDVRTSRGSEYSQGHRQMNKKIDESLAGGGQSWREEKEENSTRRCWGIALLPCRDYGVVGKKRHVICWRLWRGSGDLPERRDRAPDQTLLQSKPNKSGTYRDRRPSHLLCGLICSGKTK